jgi:hypothetical protein
MSGGLMQLVVYGAQDIFLTGNPSITYFKVVYRRHTNFATESIEQTFSETADFGNKVTALISRNGDLMTGAYIQATLPDLTEKANVTAPQYRYTRWIDNVGHYLIKSVSVDIGSQEIDRHYSDWLEIWSQLTIPAGKRKGYLRMIGQDPFNKLGQNTGLQKDVFTSSSTATASAYTAPYQTVTTVLKGRDIYVPLQFWFCRNIGLALPLIALQYHDVKINVEFRSAHELVMLNVGDGLTNGLPTLDAWKTTSTAHSTNITQSAALQASLWVDYVYLDTDERRRFAQVSHEYLIEQVQFSGDFSANTSANSNPVMATFDLNFSHPVKELIWVVKNFDSAKEYINYTDTQLPSIPPFADIGYNDLTTFIGLTGLPTGIITLNTLDMTIVTTVTSVSQDNIGTGEGANAVLTIANGGTGFKSGDIIAFENDAGNVIHITVSEVTGGVITTVNIPAITHDGDNTIYTVISVFRPTTGLNLTDNAIATGTGTDPDFTTSLSAIDTFDRLNRLTNYNTCRPVSSNGLAKNPVSTAKIRLNGRDRFAERPGEYFNWVQCKEHHTNIPQSPGINVYSFAINPEEHQPSGTCNFSRLDSVQLVLGLRQLYNGTTGTGDTGTQGTDGQAKGVSSVATVKIYATNYNILRIMSGMGGLAYAS